MAMTLAAIAARLRPAPRLPGLWLMTGAWDEAETMAAMRDLPRGAGVVFRHYDAADRAALGRRLAALARARGLVFVMAGDSALAFRLRADGFHAPEALLHRISAWRRLAPQDGSGLERRPDGDIGDCRHFCLGLLAHNTRVPRAVTADAALCMRRGVKW